MFDNEQVLKNGKETTEDVFRKLWKSSMYNDRAYLIGELTNVLLIYRLFIYLDQCIWDINQAGWKDEGDEDEWGEICSLLVYSVFCSQDTLEYNLKWFTLC